jgi:integrase
VITSEPCQNSVLDAPEREETVRKRIRFQEPTPQLRKIGGVWKWYGQWRDADGRKRSKVLGLKSEVTPSKAKAALAAIVQPINMGIDRPTQLPPTFRSYVEEIFIPFKRRRWKEGSSDGTAIQQIRSHLIPELGEAILNTTEREDLQAILDRKAPDNSESVVKHLRWALNSIFKLALSDGIVSKNPAAQLIIPKNCKPGRPRSVLSPEQIDQYLSALDLRECLAARLALIEGMRPGEILARRWTDVTGYLLRTDSRVYRGGFDTPKNGMARDVALSDGALQALAELKKLALDLEGFIFASENGDTPISRDNLWRRYMKPALDAVGLGWGTFQVLRRTNGTLSKKFGVDPKVAADQRGHGLGVSLAEYTFSDLQQKRQAVLKLESALIRKPRQKRSGRA